MLEAAGEVDNEWRKTPAVRSTNLITYSLIDGRCTRALIVGRHGPFEHGYRKHLFYQKYCTIIQHGRNVQSERNYCFKWILCQVIHVFFSLGNIHHFFWINLWYQADFWFLKIMKKKSHAPKLVEISLDLKVRYFFFSFLLLFLWIRDKGKKFINLCCCVKYFDKGHRTTKFVSFRLRKSNYNSSCIVAGRYNWTTKRGSIMGVPKKIKNRMQ